MPNHFYTEIQFPTDVSKKILKKIKKDLEKVENNLCELVMPFPKVLKGTISPTPKGGMSYYLDEEGKVNYAKEIPATPAQKKEAKKLGFTNWYDWCVHYWGTKWGTYDLSVCEDQNLIFFNSAWNSPNDEIFQLFANKYGVPFIVLGHDEGEDDVVELGDYEPQEDKVEL